MTSTPSPTPNIIPSTPQNVQKDASLPLSSHQTNKFLKRAAKSQDTIQNEQEFMAVQTDEEGNVVGWESLKLVSEMVSHFCHHPSSTSINTPVINDEAMTTSESLFDHFHGMTWKANVFLPSITIIIRCFLIRLPPSSHVSHNSTTTLSI
jgi:hypothetical protein